MKREIKIHLLCKVFELIQTYTSKQNEPDQIRSGFFLLLNLRLNYLITLIAVLSITVPPKDLRALASELLLLNLRYSVMD